MADLIGRTFKGNKILSLIGSGGMGAVYLAEHEELKKKRVVKILTRAPKEVREGNQAAAAIDNQLTERFLREARAQARLEHPNITVVHDVGAEGDIHFIVMEYLEGMNLQEYIIAKKDSLRDEKVLITMLEVVLDLAEALDHAHENGVVHRDLKPQNIMLTNLDRDKPIAKIIDFGLVQLDGSTELTSHDRSFGSPGWMAPEQHQNARLTDPRSDVYSLGAILYMILNRGVPFVNNPDLTPVEVWHHITDPEKREARFSRLKQPARGQLEVMLAVDKEARCGSMQEFAAQVRVLIRFIKLKLEERKAERDAPIPKPSSSFFEVDLSDTAPGLEAIPSKAVPTGQPKPGQPKPEKLKPAKAKDPPPDHKNPWFIISIILLVVCMASVIIMFLQHTGKNQEQKDEPAPSLTSTKGPTGVTKFAKTFDAGLKVIDASVTKPSATYLPDASAPKQVVDAQAPKPTKADASVKLLPPFPDPAKDPVLGPIIRQCWKNPKWKYRVKYHPNMSFCIRMNAPNKPFKTRFEVAKRLKKFYCKRWKCIGGYKDLKCQKWLENPFWVRTPECKRIERFLTRAMSAYQIDQRQAKPPMGM